jgi:hypothetical protein
MSVVEVLLEKSRVRSLFPLTLRKKLATFRQGFLARAEKLFLFEGPREKRMETVIPFSKTDVSTNTGTDKNVQQEAVQVEILGPGNAVSRMTAQVLDAAMRDLGLVPERDVRLDFVRDAPKIAASGVYWTPAVRVNGALKCTGRVPSLKEVRTWLQQFTQRPPADSLHPVEQE